MNRQDGISFINRVTSIYNLELAKEKVRKNKGAPGVDGVTVDELDEHMAKYYPHLIRKLKDGSYQPQPRLKELDIPKPNGGETTSSALYMDRVVQQAILQVLNALLSTRTSRILSCVLLNRSKCASSRKESTTVLKKAIYIVDCDLKSYFDTINHQKLRNNLDWYIQDKIVMKLIWKFLKSGILDHGYYTETESGTPQGGPLSPLLEQSLPPSIR